MTNLDTWQKSSYSGGGEGNACVEIAHRGPHIALRDSKHPSHRHLTLSTSSFTAFIRSLRTPHQE
ncbi:DUF397 domain-containing protein [Streptomyces sp. NPDC057877]|uniref:DUF397 domain-containing protein n=1 Tax=Streptomyces sp. NPDC057877 TaxID=3346269 RepID=UPI00369DF092